MHQGFVARNCPIWQPKSLALPISNVVQNWNLRRTLRYVPQRKKIAPFGPLKYIHVENSPRKSITVYYCTWYRSVPLREVVLLVFTPRAYVLAFSWYRSSMAYLRPQEISEYRVRAAWVTTPNRIPYCARQPQARTCVGEIDLYSSLFASWWILSANVP